ncbi:RICIN domain-containing protein [Cryptosporangium arvum]|nr:RICIN domain-containing protein [Cryptosporangium arvum]
MRRRDDGSLPIAMLLTLVALSLSTLVLDSVVRQTVLARTEIARAEALNAAQSGLDVGMAHIRSANDGTVAGVLSKLPCASLAGTVTSVLRGSYSVSVRYYAQDPQGQPASWLSGASRITCAPSQGVARTPAYALLSSVGSYSAGLGATVSRTLTAVYTFRTTNQSIPGGMIHVYRANTSETDLCLDAGSATPASGTAVTLQTCSPGLAAQNFAYDNKLRILLLSSRTTALPVGVCLDSATPHAVGNPVVVANCTTPTVQARQQWSINDSANFEGTTNGSSLDGFCFNAKFPGVEGSPVVLGSGSNCRRSYNSTQSFFPDATVGPGAAGPTNSQLVNLEQFGRCLDVTDQNVNQSFLIAWPCKQAPDPTYVAWNQKWTMPANGVSGQVVTKPGAQYCLRSPLLVGVGQYVRVVSCGTGGAALQWTRREADDSYPLSYTLVDSAGHCLSTTDPDANPPDLFNTGQRVTKIVVAACDGSARQKWNAPVTELQASPLKGVHED